MLTGPVGSRSADIDRAASWVSGCPSSSPVLAELSEGGGFCDTMVWRLPRKAPVCPHGVGQYCCAVAAVSTEERWRPCLDCALQFSIRVHCFCFSLCKCLENAFPSCLSARSSSDYFTVGCWIPFSWTPQLFRNGRGKSPHLSPYLILKQHYKETQRIPTSAMNHIYFGKKLEVCYIQLISRSILQKNSLRTYQYRVAKSYSEKLL